MNRLLPLAAALLLLLAAPNAQNESAMPDISAVTEALPEDAREVGGTLTLDGSYDGTGALRRLWNRVAEKLQAAVQTSLSPARSLLAITLLSLLARAACPDKNMAELIQSGAAAAAALLVLSGVDTLASDAVAALQELSDYSRAALPAVFTAAAATGAVVTASARYAASCLALDVMMTVTSRVTLPLVYAFLAFAVSGGIFPHPVIKAAARLSKKAAALVMTALTTVFTAYIGVTGIVTGSADAAAVKTAKTVLSGALPVVGGILSDAASAVLLAASVIKNSAGAFALIAVCALCAGPFAMLGVRVLLFRLAAAAAEMTEGDRLSSMLNDLASGMLLLLGLVGSFGVMLFFSFFSAIRVMAA